MHLTENTLRLNYNFQSWQYITNVRRSSCQVSVIFCPSLAKIGMCWQILVKVPNTKLKKNKTGRRRTVPWRQKKGRTYGYETSSFFSKPICEGKWSTVAATCIKIAVFWDIMPRALVFLYHWNWAACSTTTSVNFYHSTRHGMLQDITFHSQRR